MYWPYWDEQDEMNVDIVLPFDVTESGWANVPTCFSVTNFIGSSYWSDVVAFERICDEMKKADNSKTSDI